MPAKWGDKASRWIRWTRTPLIREVNPGDFHCVLDVGGGSGTWTLAWLQTAPEARDILFDWPELFRWQVNVSFIVVWPNGST